MLGAKGCLRTTPLTRLTNVLNLTTRLRYLQAAPRNRLSRCDLTLHRLDVVARHNFLTQSYTPGSPRRIKSSLCITITALQRKDASATSRGTGIHACLPDTPIGCRGDDSSWTVQAFYHIICGHLTAHASEPSHRAILRRGDT